MCWSDNFHSTQIHKSFAFAAPFMLRPAPSTGLGIHILGLLDT